MSYSLPVQEFIRVDITITSPLLQGRDFGLPIFITSENTPAIDQGERVREYSSLSDVGVDWDSTDEVYIMAQTAFSQNPQPERILIGVRFTTNQAGFLQCAPLEAGVDKDTFKAVTDGSFKIAIDGAAAIEVGSLDFSTVTSLSDVATVIDTALPPSSAVCTFDNDTNQFIFTSESTGDTSAIGYLESGATGTDIAGAGFLNGLQGSSSRLVNGLTVGSLTDELQNILDVRDDAYFIALAHAVDITDIDKLDVAEWNEALQTTHQFFTSSTDINILNAAVGTDLASALQGLNIQRTFMMYTGHINEYPEVSALARVSTVNFQGVDTAITLAYTFAAAGITPENGSGIGSPIFRSAQLRVANSKNANVYGLIGDVTRGRIVSNAQMSNGTYQDELHVADWLKNEIETNVANIIFNDKTKIPYSNAGLNELETGLSDAFEQGIRNGNLAPVQTSEGEFKPAYIINRVPAFAVSPTDRTSRIYKGFSFTAYLSGAIHRVIPITGTLTTVFEE